MQDYLFNILTDNGTHIIRVRDKETYHASLIMKRGDRTKALPGAKYRCSATSGPLNALRALIYKIWNCDFPYEAANEAAEHVIKRGYKKFTYIKHNLLFVCVPLVGNARKRVWLNSSDIQAVEYESKDKCMVIMKNERAYEASMNCDELVKRICEKED